MKKVIEEMLMEYQTKFTAYLQAAQILEKVDEELFHNILKKAAGCKLMIEGYQRKLKNFSE